MMKLMKAVLLSFVAGVVAAGCANRSDTQIQQVPTPAPSATITSESPVEQTRSSPTPEPQQTNATAVSSPTSAGALWQPPEPPVFRQSAPPPFLRYEAGAPNSGDDIVIELGNYMASAWRQGGNFDQLETEPGDLYHVKALIAAAQLFSLRDSYSGGNGNDNGNGLQHTIAYTETGQVKRVTFVEVDGQTDAPQALIDLVAAVRRVGELPPMAGKGANYDEPATVTYQVVQLGPTIILQIQPDGLARLYHSDEYLASMQLTEQQLSEVASLVRAADFFALDEYYTFQEPEGVIAEVPYGGVIVTQGGLSKMVEARGSQASPEGFNLLREKLAELEDLVQGTGTPSGAPDTLIGYMLITNEHTWALGIDTEGGVHWDPHVRDEAVGQLSQQELAELVAMFEQGGFYGMQDWYEPRRDTRDITTEHRVIVWINKDGEETNVQAVSGAAVPPGYQAILERLAEIHARFQKLQGGISGAPGMPPTGVESTIDSSIEALSALP